MVVPVVIAGSTFDYKPLRAEQARLAKTLVSPSPRDKDDTSQVYEVEDDQVPPFKYPTFIKVFYDKEGDMPRFELWLKDNFDQEHNLSNNNATVGINDDPLVAGNAPQSDVPGNYVISPVSGEIWQDATLNADGTVTTTGASILVGTVKFDGVTGLALAAINTRIADVSNAVEGVTKILSVVSGNLEKSLNLIR